MFEYWSLFTLTFALFIGLCLFIYLLGSRKKIFEERKNAVYTCGEPFPKVSVSPENLYVTVKDGLGIKKISELHSGKLSDYLIGFVIGLAAILALVIWL